MGWGPVNVFVYRYTGLCTSSTVPGADSLVGNYPDPGPSTFRDRDGDPWPIVGDRADPDSA